MEAPNDPELEMVLKRFEEKGETRVRQDISAGRYSPRRRQLAEYYLWLRDNDREAKFNADNLRTATSAKNAAWVAAIAAIIAAVFASMAYFFPR